MVTPLKQHKLKDGTSAESNNEGKIVGTIMVDFRKAFDLVDHDLLLHKISLYKCGTNFLRLMPPYLKNRTQVVSVHGTKFNVGEISSGVPQGSILGPLLYPLQTVFVGGYTVFTLSDRSTDRVSVTFCFLNNFKNH